MSAFKFVAGSLLAILVCAPAAARSSATQGSFENAGLTLHYTIVGHGSPVILLSGGPGFGASYMQPIVDMVARDHTAILLEQRGTGRSIPEPETAENVNEDLVVADVEALRHKLGYQRWTLLGHSFGTLTALRYAMSYPDHVAAMVLLAVMPVRQKDDPMGANFEKRLPASAGPAYGVLLAKYKAAKTAAERDEISGQMITVVLPAYLYDQSVAPRVLALSKEAGMSADTGDLVTKSVANYDLTAGLATLSIPTLIIQGEQDPLDPVMAAKTKEAIPGAKMVILERCGHFAWVEAPDRLSQHLQGFLIDK